MSSTPLRVGYQCHPFRFAGTGAEYFRIWIVNVCLSILTIGIYSAWAKVRTNRYFYANTSVDGHSFHYLADPVKILRGRLVAVALLAGYVFSWQLYPWAGFTLLGIGVLLLPAIMIVALSFTMRYSAYRNIRFHFDRDVRGLYRALLIPLFLILALTLAGYEFLKSTDWAAMMEDVEGANFHREDLLSSVFLLALMPFLPYLDYLRSRFIVEHTEYGSSRMTFGARAGAFYGIYFVSLFLFILLTAALTAVLTVVMAATVAVNSGEAGVDGKAVAGVLSFMIPFMVAFYSLMFFIMGYMRAARTNLILNNVQIGRNRFTSNLRSLRVGWIYLSNTVAIILSLGMLIPWAKVRMARYVAACTELEAGDVDSINDVVRSERSAMGDELGEAFDLDFGL